MANVALSTEDALEYWELQLRLSYLTAEIDTDITNFPPGALLPLSLNGNPTVPTLNQDGNPIFSPDSVTGLVLFPEGMKTTVGIKNKVPTIRFSSFYKGFKDHLLRFTAGYRYEELNTSETRNYGFGIIDKTSLIPPPGINVTSGELIDVTGTPLVFLPDRHRDIWSFALQDEWQFAEGWQLTAGIRYDEYSDFGSTFNPRAALVWDVNDQLTAKLLYGQAFRAPSFLEQYQQNSQLFIGNSDLNSEEIETVELAFDYRPMSTLRTALNIYFYQIDDLIGNELSFASTEALGVKNSAGQNGYGTEFEWDWHFYENWSFRGNYAWQYARNEELNRRVSGVPEHKLYSALAWRFLPQ